MVLMNSVSPAARRQLPGCRVRRPSTAGARRLRQRRDSRHAPRVAGGHQSPVRQGDILQDQALPHNRGREAGPVLLLHTQGGVEQHQEVSVMVRLLLFC